MKITIWGINYSPDLTGIAPYNRALCDFLKSRGHRLRMVTSFPYYPTCQKRLEDRRRLYRTDDLSGVPVHRSYHYVPLSPTPLKRILHEGSFVVTSLLRLLALPRPDVYVVVSPPLLLGAAAWLLTRIRRAPFVLHVQDLQPDAACGLGMLKRGLFTRALYVLEGFAYRKAARVSGISGGMLEAFERKGVPQEKVVYFPNGVELTDHGQAPPRGHFRAREGFGADEFLAVYSGNLGVKQGLEILAEAAPLIGSPRIQIVICGDGAGRAKLAEEIAKRHLRNVKLIPLQAEGRYVEMLADADLCLITQKRGAGAFFLPSKVLRNLAMGRPVLAVSDESSELTRALRAGGFGINVEPGHPDSLARALEGLAENRERLRQFGRAGREFVRQFEMTRVLEQFQKELEMLLAGGARVPALVPSGSPAAPPVTPFANRSVL